MKRGRKRSESSEGEYDFSRATRGPIARQGTGKTRITIRLDEDILAWFREQVHRSGGGNYQTLINAALRKHMENRLGRTLEQTLRRVLREELRRSPGRAR